MCSSDLAKVIQTYKAQGWQVQEGYVPDLRESDLTSDQLGFMLSPNFNPAAPGGPGFKPGLWLVGRVTTDWCNNGSVPPPGP